MAYYVYSNKRVFNKNKTKTKSKIYIYIFTHTNVVSIMREEEEGKGKTHQVTCSREINSRIFPFFVGKSIRNLHQIKHCPLADKSVLQLQILYCDKYYFHRAISIFGYFTLSCLFLSCTKNCEKWKTTYLTLAIKLGQIIGNNNANEFKKSNDHVAVEFHIGMMEISKNNWQQPTTTKLENKHKTLFCSW